MNELPDAYLPEEEVLAQLAEEAAELAQAALKLRRVLDGTNPTPLSESKARAALAEERTDVSLCDGQHPEASCALQRLRSLEAQYGKWHLLLPCERSF